MKWGCVVNRIGLWSVVAVLAMASSCAGTSVESTFTDASASASSQAPSPTTQPSARPTQSKTPSTVLRMGTATMGADKIFVEPASGVTVTNDATGAARLALTLSAGSAPTTLELTVAPPDLKLGVSGGVALLQSRDGDQGAAVPLPSVRDDAGKPVATSMVADEDTLRITITPDDEAHGPLTVTLWVGRSVIDRVEVGEERGAPRYFVFPTEFGRAMLGDGLASAGTREFFEVEGWAQAVELQPAMASVTSLEQQFDCHVLGAPRKESWNLEAFRPDNPDWLSGAMQHRCNWQEEDLPDATTGGEDSPSPAPTP